MEITRIELIEKIKEHVIENAEARRLSAGFQGRHDDGGAEWRCKQLLAWEDGIEFALTGKTILYASVVSEIEKREDPEWKEYERLRKKFGNG